MMKANLHLTTGVIGVKNAFILRHRNTDTHGAGAKVLKPHVRVCVGVEKYNRWDNV